MIACVVLSCLMWGAISDEECRCEHLGKVKLDSADKSATVSFAKDAVSKEYGENRFKQLIKKVGAEKATAMLEKAEEGFKENYALLKKLSEMSSIW